MSQRVLLSLGKMHVTSMKWDAPPSSMPFSWFAIVFNNRSIRVYSCTPRDDRPVEIGERSSSFKDARGNTSFCIQTEKVVGVAFEEDPLGDPFGDPFGDPLGDFLGDPLGDFLGDPFGDPFGDLLGDAFGEVLGDTLGLPFMHILHFFLFASFRKVQRSQLH